MENVKQQKAEFDWKDLLKKPAKLFGYSYFYFIIMICTIGYLYISNLTIIGKNSVAPFLQKDSSALIQDIPIQNPRVIPPIDVMKFSASTPELIAKGTELYKRNCISCHGDNGNGDGQTSGMLNPKPRNFHSLDGWKNGAKVSQIYKTLQEGIAGSAMSSYSYLSPEERFAVIHYVRSFVSNYPIDSPDELKQLDVTYQLSKGINISGQIPVKKATKILIFENEQGVKRIEWLVGVINSDSRYGLLKELAADKLRLVTALSRDPNALSSKDMFIKLVSVDPLHLGLNVKVLRYSDSEWKNLYDEVYILMKEGL